MSRLFISALLVVVCLTLGWPSAAVAAPWSGATTSSPGTSPWDFITRLSSFLSTFWADGGCTLDPNGRCGEAPDHLRGDNGCTLDPSGGCRESSETSWAEEGCTLDPSGRCGESPDFLWGEGGCTLDPDGRCRQ